MNNEVDVFRQELEYFRCDVEGGLQSLYAYLAFHNIASQRQSLLRALRKAPLLWNTLLAALQNNQFILLGRLFDRTTAHNAYKLLEFARTHMALFSKEALALRKANGAKTTPPWVAEYVAQAYVPHPSDFARLASYLEKRSQLYLDKFRAIRSKVVAHKVIADPEEIKVLYSQSKYGEIIDIYIFLHRLYECLWELLENGRKPILKQQHRSVRRLQASCRQQWESKKVQEVIVQEAKEFLRMIEYGQSGKVHRSRRKVRQSTTC